MLKYEDPVRYDEWRITDVVPMLHSEHSRLHCKGKKFTEEHKLNLSKSLIGNKCALGGKSSTGHHWKWDESSKVKISKIKSGVYWWNK